MKYLFSLCVVAISIISALLIFEISYRVFPDFFKAGPDYKDLYQSDTIRLGGLLKPTIDTLATNGKGSLIKWTTNDEGFRNSTPFKQSKEKNTFRIVSIGDSFSSGYRVDQKATYSFLLQQKLNTNSQGLKYEVLIVNIEDPATGLYYLQNNGNKLNADLIIWGITLGNDITQSYLNTHINGKYAYSDNLIINENFNADSIKNVYEERLPEEACSYRFRLLDYLEKFVFVKLIINLLPNDYTGESIFASNGKTNPVIFDLSHGLGLFLNKPQPSISNAYTHFKENLNHINAWSIENHTPICFIQFPQRFQVQPMDWKKTIKHYDLKKEAFDLFRPNSIIAEYCKENNINVFDLTASLSAESLQSNSSLYLPLGDMHWNRQGHRVVSNEIYQYINKNALTH